MDSQRKDQPKTIRSAVEGRLLEENLLVPEEGLEPSRG